MIFESPTLLTEILTYLSKSDLLSLLTTTHQFHTNILPLLYKQIRLNDLESNDLPLQLLGKCSYVFGLSLGNNGIGLISNFLNLSELEVVGYEDKEIDLRACDLSCIRRLSLIGFKSIKINQNIPSLIYFQMYIQSDESSDQLASLINTKSLTQLKELKLKLIKLDPILLKAISNHLSGLKVLNLYGHLDNVLNFNEIFNVHKYNIQSLILDFSFESGSHSDIILSSNCLPNLSSLTILNPFGELVILSPALLEYTQSNPIWSKLMSISSIPITMSWCNLLIKQFHHLTSVQLNCIQGQSNYLSYVIQRLRFLQNLTLIGSYPDETFDLPAYQYPIKNLSLKPKQDIDRFQVEFIMMRCPVLEKLEVSNYQIAKQVDLNTIKAIKLNSLKVIKDIANGTSCFLMSLLPMAPNLINITTNNLQAKSDITHLNPLIYIVTENDFNVTGLRSEHSILASQIKIKL